MVSPPKGPGGAKRRLSSSPEPLITNENKYLTLGAVPRLDALKGSPQCKIRASVELAKSSEHAKDND